MKRKRPRTEEERVARAKRRMEDPDNTSNLHHLNPISRQYEIKKLFLPVLEKIFAFYGWTKNTYFAKINTVKIVKKDVHEAWNDLFSNMFAWDAVAQIRLWSSKDLDLRVIVLNKTQEKAWSTVFGWETTPREAIKIIMRDWWPEFPTEADFKRFLSNKKGE